VKGIFDSSGNLYEILTIGRDVTNLKNAELEKSNYIKDLERIAHMTSHNVRGPIASMLGFIELLRMNAIESDQWNNVLHDLKKCIKDLDVYTQELGSFIYQRQSS
jgi:signal transduction histidine kinase